MGSDGVTRVVNFIFLTLKKTQTLGLLSSGLGFILTEQWAVSEHILLLKSQVWGRGWMSLSWDTLNVVDCVGSVWLHHSVSVQAEMSFGHSACHRVRGRRGSWGLWGVELQRREETGATGQWPLCSASGVLSGRDQTSGKAGPAK